MASIPLTSDTAVVALLGFAIWETHKAYRECAPSLPNLRICQPNSDEYFTYRQQLVDSDVTVGLVAIGAGLAAAWMTRRWEPLILVMATLGAIGWYHHSILGSTPV